MMTDRLLTRDEVREMVGQARVKTGSFDNWLTDAYNELGFPRPKKIGLRSVRWRASEVQKWMDGLQSSDASASPNKKAKAKAKAKAEAAARMAQALKQGVWVCAHHNQSTDRPDRKKRA